MIFGNPPPIQKSRPSRPIFKKSKITRYLVGQADKAIFKKSGERGVVLGYPCQKSATIFLPLPAEIVQILKLRQRGVVFAENAFCCIKADFR